MFGKDNFNLNTALLLMISLFLMNIFVTSIFQSATQLNWNSFVICWSHTVLLRLKILTMPSIKEFVASLRHEVFDFVCDSPEDITSTAKSLAMCTFTKTRLTSRINFIGRCLQGSIGSCWLFGRISPAIFYRHIRMKGEVNIPQLLQTTYARHYPCNDFETHSGF